MAQSNEPIALISDIHGNLEALSSVLQDIKEQGIETVINLGDVVGYGPDPEACIDLVTEHCSVNLCGNHDHAILNGAVGFNPVAKAAVDFVREKLRPEEESPDPEKVRRWEFLGKLEPKHCTEKFEAMHGSPREPIIEYVLPSDPEIEPYKLEEIFDAMQAPIAFVGHTHFPGIIEENGGQFLLPSLFYNKYSLTGKRIIVNVGSVGQPRDRDARSCYTVFDGQHIVYRRVEYDIDTTVAKVHKSGGLHEICGLRLLEGR